MAGVALALLRVHPGFRGDRQAFLLPGEDAALHIGGVLVAELALEQVGGTGRAVARAAVEDHPLRGVRSELVYPLGDLGGRHQDIALEVRLGVLVGLADVEQDDLAVRAQLLPRLLGRQLLDPALDQF